MCREERKFHCIILRIGVLYIYICLLHIFVRQDLFSLCFQLQFCESACLQGALPKISKTFSKSISNQGQGKQETERVDSGCFTCFSWRWIQEYEDFLLFFFVGSSVALILLWIFKARVQSPIHHEIIYSFKVFAHLRDKFFGNMEVYWTSWWRYNSLLFQELLKRFTSKAFLEISHDLMMLVFTVI